MKKSTLLSGWLAVFCWLISSPLFAQPEKICSRETGLVATICGFNSEAASWSTNSGNLFLDPTINTVDLGGWYKACWVFGDGNFLYFPASPHQRMEDNLIHSLNSGIQELAHNSASADATSHNVPYIYSIPANNKASVHLTEKYSNEEEPGIPKQIITSGSTPTNSTNHIKTLNSGENMSVITNHSFRTGYPTLMVVSWSSGLSPRKLRIYFNGERNPSTEVVSANHRLFKSGMGEVFSYPPIYLPSSLETTNATGASASPFASNYNDYIEYDLGNLDKKLVKGEEIRMFTTFVTQDLNGSDQTAHAHFKAVLLNADNGVIAQKDYTAQMVTSHDPNFLEVQKIEKIGADKFKVYLKTQVCNISAQTALGIGLNIETLDPSAPFTQYTVISPATWNNDAPSVSGNITSFDYSHLTINGSPHYPPKCIDFYFTVLTNSAGIQKLQQTDPNNMALKACSYFMDNQDDKHYAFNTPIPKDYQIYNDCDGKNTITWKDFKLWIIISIILLIALICCLIFKK